MMQQNTEQPGEIIPRKAELAQGSKLPRIDVWRLGKRMLLVLIIPCVVAIGVDIAAGTWPLATLITAAFAFPLAGLLVMRAALQELQKIIDEIAPEQLEENDSGVESGESGVANGA